MTATNLTGHYLLIQRDDDRVYWPLDSEDEEPRQALGRWIEAEVEKSGRRRKLDKLRESIRADVTGYRLCRPTSYWRRQAENAGHPFPAPVHNGRRRRRR